MSLRIGIDYVIELIDLHQIPNKFSAVAADQRIPFFSTQVS
jgi:hypothetical protein